MFERVEVLKAGTFRDTAGAEHTFTRADLASIAAKYDPVKHEAPVVVGHPKDNAPAFGWVKRAFVEGESLFLELKDLVSEFVDAVRRGMYKKRSISLYPDMSIRHIGFLGAMPPAVKGLADIKFSDNDGAVDIEFAQGKNSTEGSIMELAQALARITVLESECGNLKTENGTLKSGNAALEKANGEFSEKLASAETKITALEGDIKKRDELVSGLNTKVLAQEASVRKAAHVAFCEKLVREGRILPKNKDATVELLETLHQASVSGNFAEGESPLAKQMKLLEESPAIIQFGEGPHGSKSGVQGTAGEKLDQIARKKMADDKTLSFGEACSLAQTENPELAMEYAEECVPKR